MATEERGGGTPREREAPAAKTKKAPRREQAERKQRKATGSSGSVEEAINRLTKWIPGEALVFYAAAVTAVTAKEDAEPSIALLVIFAVVTIALVVGGEFASSGEIPRKSWVAAGLAAVAFLIWSVTIPFSGWQRWDLVAENQELVTLMAAVLALLFCLFAEGIKKRLEKLPDKNS